MEHLLKVQSEIYNQFHASPAGEKHFYQPVNADAYAAYYTSMYLIQDTGETVWDHMGRGFSTDPMRAYLEFWGVMQAIEIQQDAIFEIHQAVVGSAPTIQPESSWSSLRNIRHLCAGHPANRPHGVSAPQRTFMGRSFGGYEEIQYEMWDAATGTSTHPVFNLRKMITDYDLEAKQVLDTVLSTMKSKWP